MAKRAPSPRAKRSTPTKSAGKKRAAQKSAAPARRSSSRARAAAKPRGGAKARGVAGVKRGRIDALTQVFAALGAQEPLTWARSHV